jgi:uncharacterized protein (DUF1015 family)
MGFYLGALSPITAQRRCRRSPAGTSLFFEPKGGKFVSKIRPFKALRPTVDKASKVASPPYDVLSSDEARQMAKDNPISFLRVIKPEVDFEPSVDVYSDSIYQRGLDNLEALVNDGVLLREERPCLYLYEQQMRINGQNHAQVGLVAGVSVDEYQNGLIKKHEFTRPQKEADRTRHVNKTNANTGPVFLTYRSNAAINALVDGFTKRDPTYDFVADDGIRHRLWVIDQQTNIDQLVSAFQKVCCLYIADGHHRSASASSVREIRKAANPNHTGEEAYNYFLAVIFPHDRMYIMDYNRVVSDLAGHNEEALITLIEEKFDVSQTDTPRPDRFTEFGMYLGQKWYRLKAKPGTFDPNDPVESLDVAILQNNLLAPILGIADPRTDDRIDFVGGIRGTKELEKRVDTGGGVAFAMYPTSIEQLMNIADAGQVMPPKSTWFEPKLRSGLVVRMLD